MFGEMPFVMSLSQRTIYRRSRLPWQPMSKRTAGSPVLAWLERAGSNTVQYIYIYIMLNDGK